MSAEWEDYLNRWTAAGLLDSIAVGRIRAWESEQAQPRGWRWPVWIALALGALLFGAGVLLFVSAHWDDLPAAQRMALVLMLVGGFHAAGAVVAGRFDGLSVALHAVGTVALGAGIALAGQIFNLSEHWPTAIFLWAAGAALAWALLRHWTQGALTAILAPYWLASEAWVNSHQGREYVFTPVAAGIFALSVTYLTARRAADDSLLRKALSWIGGIALLPAAFWTAVEAVAWRGTALEWIIAVGVPLLLAFLLRRHALLWNGVAGLWILILAAAADGRGGNIGVYAWCAVGAIGLVSWGVVEARAERINLGMIGFALTVLFFYFSNVMDKLGRSASLMILGVLFLGGGWALERMRRQLIAQIRPEAV